MRLAWIPLGLGFFSGGGGEDWGRWGSLNRDLGGGSRFMRGGGVQKRFSAQDSRFKSGTTTNEKDLYI